MNVICRRAENIFWYTIDVFDVFFKYDIIFNPYVLEINKYLLCIEQS